MTRRTCDFARYTAADGRWNGQRGAVRDVRVAREKCDAWRNERPASVAIYDETEHWYRDHPEENFPFVPVGINAQKQGRLVCFRRAANLPKEAVVHEWVDVLWLDRKCPTWFRREPGVAPFEQLAEDRSRRFTLDLKGIESRLT